MNYYTLEEKKAIFKILKTITLADGRIDEGEIKYMKQLCNDNVLELTKNDMDKADLMEYGECILILSRMYHDKKESFVIMMTEMINADGEIHEKEIVILLTIGKLVGISGNLLDKHVKRIIFQ